MSSANSETSHSATLTSHVPGRFRLKLKKAHRTPDRMERLGRDLAEKEGVHDVQYNHRTGSVTVQYDHSRYGKEDIGGLLRDVDVVVESLAHVPTIKESPERRPNDFAEAVEDLDRHWERRTGRPLRLNVLLPLSCLAAGIWSIRRYGWMMERIPGWLFVWLAFDMFVKLRPDRRPPEET